MSKRPNQTVTERFWSKVEKTPTCWNWKSWLNNKGYGVFHLAHSNQNILAHRFAYILANGPIPEGKELDHLCRNRACVNPTHLEAVTRKENIRRGISPAAFEARQTHCKRGHPLTTDNLVLSRLLKTGKRLCLTCTREYERQRKRRRR